MVVRPFSPILSKKILQPFTVASTRLVLQWTCRRVLGDDSLHPLHDLDYLGYADLGVGKSLVSVASGAEERARGRTYSCLEESIRQLLGREPWHSIPEVGKDVESTLGQFARHAVQGVEFIHEGSSSFVQFADDSSRDPVPPLAGEQAGALEVGTDVGQDAVVGGAGSLAEILGATEAAAAP